MMLAVKIQRGLTSEHLQAAAKLYAIAFERESAYFFGDKMSIMSIFPRIVNPDQMLALVTDDHELIGITGFSFLRSPMIRVRLVAMLQVYGFWMGILRYVRWRLFFYRTFPERHLYIDAVTIKEGYRGKGYVRFLLHETEQIAIKKGITYMVLDVVDDNMPAFQAYKKEGYSKVKFYRLPPRFAKIFQMQKVTRMVKVLTPN